MRTGPTVRIRSRGSFRWACGLLPCPGCHCWPASACLAPAAHPDATRSGASPSLPTRVPRTSYRRHADPAPGGSRVAVQLPCVTSMRMTRHQSPSVARSRTRWCRGARPCKGRSKLGRMTCAANHACTIGRLVREGASRFGPTPGRNARGVGSEAPVLSGCWQMRRQPANAPDESLLSSCYTPAPDVRSRTPRVFGSGAARARR